MIRVFRAVISHGIKVPAIILINGTMTMTLSLMERGMIAAYFFDYPTVVITVQMAAVLFLIEFARIFGILKMQPYSFVLGKNLLLPSLLTSIVAYISVNAVEQCWGIKITMLNSIKQFAPLFSMFLLQSMFGRSYPARPLQLIIAALCTFSAITVFVVFAVDFFGFLLALLTTIALASSSVLFENAGRHYSPVEMLYIHSFNCVVFLLLADLYEDEVRDSLIYFFYGLSPGFVLNAIFVVVFGVILQFVQFYSFVYVGAVTTGLTTCVAAAIEVVVAFALSRYIYFDQMPSMINAICAVLTVITGIAILHANPQLKVMTATTKESQEIFSN